MDIKKEIGEKIKRYRKKRGYTQEKLSELIDISPRNLSNIELGISFPKAETLEKLLKILEVSSQELFATEDVKTEDDLLKSIYGFIEIAKTERSLLERAYRVLKAICEE